MRREQFLAEMEQVVPWTELEAVIAPVYPTGTRSPANWFVADAAGVLYPTVIQPVRRSGGRCYLR